MVNPLSQGNLGDSSNDSHSEEAFAEDGHFPSRPDDRELASDDLTTDDLEAMYLGALEKMESIDWPSLGGGQSNSNLEDESPFRTEVEIAGSDFLSPPSQEIHATESSKSGVKNPIAKTSKEKSLQDVFGDANGEERVAPQAIRIIEAALFVGGAPLSAKKLVNLLESAGDASVVDQMVDELNQEYGSQHRPYEIRLVDGGYKLTLRSEYEPLRNRVYGVGPREVKLSQDVLEVLALVAYQQPISHADVEACGKPNAANLLRQLLRRELICLERVDQSRHGVEYRTTNRFLQLFGLGNLNEMPRPEELSLR